MLTWPDPRTLPPDIACDVQEVRLGINPCAAPAKMQLDFASGLDIDKELNLLSEKIAHF